MIDPYTLAKKDILEIRPYKPGKPIEELKRELGIKDVIKMASNENALGPSPKALEAVKNSFGEINYYPDAMSFDLKQKLAQQFKLHSDNFIVGNGSDEVIVFAVRAFCRPADEIIIANPTFLIYKIAAMQEGANIKFVPMANLKYNLKAMKDAVTEKTKLIFIANPDNPTGSYVTKQQVEEFMDGLPEGIIVFFDEAYFEYVTAEDYPDTLKYLNKKNVIIARTFSKIYGMAGLRVGYAISDADTINILGRVREPFNVNRLAQIAACAALDDKEFLEKSKKFAIDGKNFIYEELDDMQVEYYKSQTNFVLINVKTDALDVYHELLKKGIIVREMRPWGLDTFIRVTIGTLEQNERFIKALGEVLENSM